MTGDVGVGLFQRINKTERRLLSRLAQIVGKGLVNVVIGQRAQ
jgi:hypothetical protein